MRRGEVPKPSPKRSEIDSSYVGARLREIFRADAAPSVVTNHLHVAQIAATEVRSSSPTYRPTEPADHEDAYVVGLILQDAHNHQVWEDGRALPKFTELRGQSLIRDLNRTHMVLNDQPMHAVLFYMPRAALDEIADDLEAPRFSELRYQPGTVMDDPVISSLGYSLLPSFARPEQTNAMFLEYVAFAVGSHVAQAYGGLKPGFRLRKGGLGAWQERQAKEALSASLKGEASLRDVARLCGLSVSHFSRAFKDTTGVAPYQWLLLRRVEAAKVLLRQRQMMLSEIALECGFADQSHFTRVFSRVTGISPGAWRRSIGISGDAISVPYSSA